MRRFFVVLAVLCPMTSSAGEPSAERMSSAYARAISEFLAPSKQHALAIRFHPGSREQTSEYTISFIETGPTDDAIRDHRVELVTAPKPVLHQVGELLEQYESEPLPLVVRRVRTERFDLFVQGCPAIRSAVSAFFEVAGDAFRPADDGPVLYHGPWFEITGITQRLYFELSVYPDNPFFDWATKTHNLLRSCLPQPGAA